MQTNRSWFPYISVGLTVLLALIFGANMYKDGNSHEASTSSSSAEERMPLVTDESYRAAVGTVLDAYAQEKDARATYNSLVILRVPEGMQQVHFDLVVAMGKLSAGDKADGEARLSALKAENSWLPL